MKLPQEFARFAEPMAKANPIAFPKGAEDALRKMTECYRDLVKNEIWTAVNSSGFRFEKDEDGFIDMWVCPDIVWRDAGKPAA